MNLHSKPTLGTVAALLLLLLSAAPAATAGTLTITYALDSGFFTVHEYGPLGPIDVVSGRFAIALEADGPYTIPTGPAYISYGNYTDDIQPAILEWFVTGTHTNGNHVTLSLFPTGMYFKQRNDGSEWVVASRGLFQPYRFDFLTRSMTPSGAVQTTTRHLAYNMGGRGLLTGPASLRTGFFRFSSAASTDLGPHNVTGQEISRVFVPEAGSGTLLASGLAVLVGLTAVRGRRARRRAARG